MKFLLPLSLFVALGSFVALSPGTVHAKAAVPDGVFNGADLTAAELASALKVSWWNLEIPEDFDSDRMLGVCFKDENGLLGRSGGSTGWEPGSQAKVFLMDMDKETLRFAIVGSRIAVSGSLPNKMFALGENSATSSVGSGSIVSLDEILVRRSESGRVTNRELRTGEIGITVGSEPLD